MSKYRVNTKDVENSLCFDHLGGAIEGKKSSLGLGNLPSMVKFTKSYSQSSVDLFLPLGLWIHRSCCLTSNCPFDFSLDNTSFQEAFPSLMPLTWACAGPSFSTILASVSVAIVWWHLDRKFGEGKEVPASFPLPDSQHSFIHWFIDLPDQRKERSLWGFITQRGHAGGSALWCLLWGNLDKKDKRMHSCLTLPPPTGHFMPWEWNLGIINQVEGCLHSGSSYHTPRWLSRCQPC